MNNSNIHLNKDLLLDTVEKIPTRKGFGEGLREAGEIRLFKMGSEENSMCVVFLDDYKSHVLRFTETLDVDHHLIGWSMFWFLYENQLMFPCYLF